VLRLIDSLGSSQDLLPLPGTTSTTAHGWFRSSLFELMVCSQDLDPKLVEYRRIGYELAYRTVVACSRARSAHDVGAMQ
jgi:hypothetical protein